MKQRMVFGGLWLLAALIAMAVVNQGLDALGAAARSDRVATVPMPVTADVAAGESALAEAESDDASETSTSTASADAEIPPLATISSSTTTTTAATAAPPTTRPVSTTPPPAVTAAPPPITTTTTTTPPPPPTTIGAVIRCDDTEGGTVCISYSPELVKFESARVTDPYSWEDPERIDAITLELEFESDHRRVRMIATWLDGRPSFTIRDDHG